MDPLWAKAEAQKTAMTINLDLPIKPPKPRTQRDPLTKSSPEKTCIADYLEPRRRVKSCAEGTGRRGLAAGCRGRLGKTRCRRRAVGTWLQASGYRLSDRDKPGDGHRTG